MAGPPVRAGAGGGEVEGHDQPRGAGLRSVGPGLEAGEAGSWRYRCGSVNWVGVWRLKGMTSSVGQASAQLGLTWRLLKGQKQQADSGSAGVKCEV